MSYRHGGSAQTEDNPLKTGLRQPVGRQAVGIRQGSVKVLSSGLSNWVTADAVYPKGESWGEHILEAGE